MPGAPYQRQADMPVLEGAKNATSDVGAMLGTDPHSAGLANAGWTRNRPDWAGNQ